MLMLVTLKLLRIDWSYVYIGVNGGLEFFMLLAQPKQGFGGAFFDA